MPVQTPSQVRTSQWFIWASRRRDEKLIKVGPLEVPKRDNSREKLQVPTSSWATVFQRDKYSGGPAVGTLKPVFRGFARYLQGRRSGLAGFSKEPQRFMIDPQARENIWDPEFVHQFELQSRCCRYRPVANSIANSRSDSVNRLRKKSGKCVSAFHDPSVKCPVRENFRSLDALPFRHRY